MEIYSQEQVGWGHWGITNYWRRHQVWVLRKEKSGLRFMCKDVRGNIIYNKEENWGKKPEMAKFRGKINQVIPQP